MRGCASSYHSYQERDRDRDTETQRETHTERDTERGEEEFLKNVNFV